jgi:hypothetical protein
MSSINFSETSVRIYQTTLRQRPKERRSYWHRGRSLKLRISSLKNMHLLLARRQWLTGRLFWADVFILLVSILSRCVRKLFNIGRIGTSWLLLFVDTTKRRIPSDSHHSPWSQFFMAKLGSQEIKWLRHSECLAVKCASTCQRKSTQRSLLHSDTF